jgi:tetratricopeptide (TPR) repeat protein
MEAVMRRVELLFDQQRFAEARGMLMQGLADDPEHPMLNAFLAYCLRMENRAEEGLAPARHAASREPEWAFVHYVLALVYEGLEKPKDALSALDTAISLEPQDPNYHGLKAAILFQTGKWHKAIESAEQGLKADPQHTQCRGILTAANNQLGRHDEVEHLVDESLRNDPQNAFAFANKGWSCLRQRNQKEAIRHFKEALRLEPDLEWARHGALEALKAHNFLYRGLLAFFFKMGTLPQGAQFGIMIGLFIAFRVARSVGESNPALQPYVTPLIIAYLAFAYATWVGMSLANCALLFHPFGRMAMNKKEKRDARVLGGTLLAAVMTLGFGLYKGSPQAIELGVLLIMTSLPLVGAQNAGTPKGLRIGVAMTAAIFGLGVLGIFVLEQLFGVAMLLWIAYIWVIGQYVTRH